jgi:hypothetical protein
MDAQITMDGCTLHGTMISGSNLGAFVGKLNASASLTVTDCINYATISNDKNSGNGNGTGSLIGIVEGTVTATNYVNYGTITTNSAASVGGFFGIVHQDTANVTMTDCANYGTITSKTPDLAGGLVGHLVNKGTFTRCYNAGTVATALVNVNQEPEKTKAVVIEDTYYLAGTDVKALTKTAAATDVTLKYDGAAATDAKTATVAELVAKTPFKAAGEYKGWVLSKDGKTAMPLMVMENIEGHNYTTKVTAPTCSTRGFTTYTCACGHSYEGDYVDTTDHTEGADWIVDKAATEEFSGSRHKECTVCHATLKTEIIQALKPAETTAPAEETT